tara:strand:+ start:214 stop:732 length:519 start_codon:yes stop_codon:yes gene_type:complete
MVSLDTHAALLVLAGALEAEGRLPDIRRVDSPPRYCLDCPAQLSPTSMVRTVRCASCAGRKRERERPERDRSGRKVVAKPKVVELPTPIKGTAMPLYAPKPPSKNITRTFEIVACGLSNSPTLYNVYVGVDHVGRVEKVDGLWRVQGTDLGTHDKAITAARTLVECLTRGSE